MSKREGHLSNPDVQGRLRENAKNREALVADAVRTVMNNPQGRALMAHIVLDLLGLRSVCLDHSERGAALWEGRRWAARLIDELLEQTEPEGYHAMHVERLVSTKADDQLKKVAVQTEDEDA